MSNKEETSSYKENLGGPERPRLLKLGELGPPPVGAPVDLRERLARALKTTDRAVLRDAEAAYRGVYESEHAYIVEQIADHLQPPDMSWLLACCDPDALREGYEGRALVVWSIALEHGGCMVFESVREAPGVLGALLGLELADDADELPRPLARTRPRPAPDEPLGLC